MRLPSLPIHSANAIAAPLTAFPSRSLDPFSVFPSSILQPPSVIPINVPPAVIRSQTPYIRGNIFITSSSNTSRSSVPYTIPASSVRPSSIGLIYSQASFADSRRGSVLSGQTAEYQSLRP